MRGGGGVLDQKYNLIFSVFLSISYPYLRKLKYWAGEGGAPRKIRYERGGVRAVTRHGPGILRSVNRWKKPDTYEGASLFFRWNNPYYNKLCEGSLT